MNRDYRIQLIAELNTKLAELDIKKLGQKRTVQVSAELSSASKAKLESELNKIQDVAKKMKSIKIFSDDYGGIKKALVTYTDGLGRVRTKAIEIDKAVKATVVSTHDLSKEEKEIEKTEERLTRLKEQQKSDMEKMVLSADKFLERSKTLEKTPQVTQGIGIAKQMKLETDPQKLAELNRQLSVLTAGINQSGHAAWSWGEQMKVAGQRALEWASVTTVIYGALEQLKQGVQYIKDLDKEMTNIQIATGLSREETNGLAKEYNSLAKELKVSTIEVAKGAVTWLKQGKSVEEAGILIRDTTMLAKLGMIDTAEASEYLTSVLNGFQLDASEATGVIDRLVSVDNAAATSVSELSVALSRSANVARISGVSFENLVAYIGTVSSVTRRSAESVGESFKTLFSRMADIQKGGLDEEGMDINQVERALGRVNITLRDSQNSFREFDDVLQDVANGWKDYDDITKADIAKTIAGTRQREIFVSLMENQGMVQNLLNEQMNAGGLALDRYDDYLQSVEASQEKFNATWEEFMSAVIDSGMIQALYDVGSAILEFGTSLTSVDNPLTGTKEKINLLIPILTLLVSLLLSTNQAFAMSNIKTFIVSMFNVAKATGTATTAAQGAAVSFNAMIPIIGAVVAVLYTYNEQITKVQKIGMEKNIEAWEKVSKGANNATEAVENYRKKLEEVGEVVEREKDKGWMQQLALNFVDQQKIIDNGLIATEKEIRRTAKSYDEYIEKMREAAKLAGYEGFNPKEGKFFKTTGSAEYLETLKLATKAEMDAAAGMADMERESTRLRGSLVQTSDAVGEMVNVSENTKEFADNLSYYIAASAEAFDSDVMSDGFKQQENWIYELNQLYEKGLVTEEEYFRSIADNLDNMDFAKTFGENQEAAQLFYAGIAQNSMAAFAQITTDFNNGTINANEYSLKLQNLGDVFLELGEISTSFGSLLGMDEEGLASFNSAISSSIGIIQNGQAELAKMQAMNEETGMALQALAENNLQFGTQEYNTRMQQIAQLAMASGQVFYDTQGNALQSEQEIYSFLTGSTENFKNFAQQSTNILSSVFTKVRTGIGQMLVQIGGAIKQMKFNISITPKMSGFENFAASILGSVMDGAIQLPKIDLEVGGAEQVGSAIQSFGQGLIDAPPVGLDLGDLFQGGGTPAPTGGFGGFADSIDKASSAMDNLGDSADDAAGKIKQQYDDIKSLLDIVIAKIKQEKEAQKDALKDRLDAFKKDIEMRKRRLRLMEEERDYQNELENKQKEVSDIQNELLELSLDDSEEAAARRRQLEEELAEKKEDLDEYQHDKAIKDREKMLDDELRRFENMINKKLEKIDDYLKKSGQIAQDAMALINKGGQAFYDELIRWNKVYGDGITSTITSAWDSAYSALNKYRDSLGQINVDYALGQIQALMDSVRELNSLVALSAGGGTEFSGSTNLTANSTYTPFAPSMMMNTPETSASNVGLTFGNVLPINVAGNLDRTVLPDIEKLANKVIDTINETMSKRGYRRLTNQYGAA